MSFKTIDLEDGMPTVEEARERLRKELANAKKAGFSAVKLIHGYGSSGEGGRLRIAIRKSLSLRKKEGFIKAFVPGEDWSIFEGDALEILEVCPELKKDDDLNGYNKGVTIVLL